MAQRKRAQGTSATTSTSRRDFIKSSAVVAGGAAFAASGLSIARGAHAAGGDEVKIALVGCGGRGSGAADQALSTSDQGPIKLVALADAFRESVDSTLRT